MEIQDKFSILKNRIRPMQSLAVAFSGGVDSTFLLKVAHNLLQENVVAVTVQSRIYPEREFRQAVELARNISARQVVVHFEALDLNALVGEVLVANPIKVK